MELKKCEGCGKLFTPRNSKQNYCGSTIQIECPICHTMFEAVCSKTVKQACSPKCSSELIKLNRQISASRSTRLCKFCGKPFTPRSARSVYCDGPHYRECVTCGKQFEIKDPSRKDVSNTCSMECKKAYQSKQCNRDLIRERTAQAMLASWC